MATQSKLQIKREVSMDITYEEARALYPVMKAEAQALIEKSNDDLKACIRKPYDGELKKIREMFAKGLIDIEEFNKEVLCIKKKVDASYDSSKFVYDENLVEFKIYPIVITDKKSGEKAKHMFASLMMHFNTDTIEWERSSQEYKASKSFPYLEYKKDPGIVEAFKQNFIKEAYFKDRRINVHDMVVKVVKPKPKEDKDGNLIPFNEETAKVSVSIKAMGSELLSGERLYNYEVWEAKLKGQYWCSMYIPCTIRSDAEKASVNRQKAGYNLWTEIREAVSDEGKSDQYVSHLMSQFTIRDFNERMMTVYRAEQLTESSYRVIRDLLRQGDYLKARERIRVLCVYNTLPLICMQDAFKSVAYNEGQTVVMSYAICHCKELKKNTPRRDMTYEYQCTVIKNKKNTER